MSTTRLITWALSGFLRPGRVASRFNPLNTARDVTIAPAIGGALGFAGRPNNRGNAVTLRPHQHNPSPPNPLLRRVAVRHPTLQRRPILERQLDVRIS